MRISEITSANKPYIRISKGKKKVDVPIIPKYVVVPPGKINRKKYAFVGCQDIRVQFRGKTVKLNWAFNHNKMTLFCSSGRKAYSWMNVRVATYTSPSGKKEQLVVCKREYGEETERRRFKRYPVVKHIIVRQGANAFNADTVDISYAGVGISIKQNVKIIPSQPLDIDFSDSSHIRARLVRSVFREDGSQIIGCHVPKAFRFEMAKLVRIEDDIERALKHGSDNEREADTDDGWYEGSIKKWH